MFKIFQDCPGLITAISEKVDGAMKLVGDSLKDKEINENRERFFTRLGIDSGLTIKADLVHGRNVEIVSSQDLGQKIEKTDGLITGDRNLFLTITVADCLPIFIFDPEKEIIALIHGGWRNLAKNILAVAVKEMRKNFSDLPKDILVGIGPGISQCHFEVKEDLLADFKFLGLAQNSHERENFALLKKRGKLFLDLKKVAKLQLIKLGIKPENIEINPECTFCLPGKYFSFRRDKLKEVKTMLAVIGRK